MIPYRLALAGGWIDQPFISEHNPEPPGSMVVVSLEPRSTFMDRSGFATSTRATAARLWGETVPARDPAALMRELYAEENRGRSEPSGSQDMAGLVYAGISRLDYDFRTDGGVFPCHVESTTDPAVVAWLEKVVWLIPVAPRPEGYDPLEQKNLDPHWIRWLGRSGKECYEAILAKNVVALGASLNRTMACWEAILPRTVRHPALQTDLKSMLDDYQSWYPGAMYSGCGGGYLIVVSEDKIRAGLKVKVRTK
ncbi:MAG TPA: hypothetical protein VEG35_00395 [Burkholderiales bacterium]|nr:hypothetical protein [Burkholderiales bacterium]